MKNIAYSRLKIEFKEKIKQMNLTTNYFIHIRNLVKSLTL